MNSPAERPEATGDSLVGQILDGRYRIDAVIARGGMAMVYRGTDLRLQRPVAIKILHPGHAADPEFIARFQREARSAARLTHPHVVAVHDQGDSDGRAYLVMEYIPGRTMRDVLRDHGALTPAQALVLLEPVLEALSAAHDAGLIHRDIKPENVLISDEGRVKVADFGLARAITGDADLPTLTQGLLLGTAAYLAPEQIETGRADARSDVYAAGVLLYELIVGRPPFVGDSPLSVAYQHVHAGVPAPSQARADIPELVDALVLRATHRRADERFPDGADFLTDLRRVRSLLPAPTPLVRRHAESATPPSDTRTAASSAPATSPASLSADAPTVALSTTQTTVLTPARASSPRRRGRRWLGALAIAVLLGASGWFGWQWWSSNQQIPVPSVAALTVTGATTTLELAGLMVDSTSTEFSETVEAGRVIGSLPPMGQPVAPGTPVVLIVSEGPERFPVPDLSGLTPDAATTALAQVNLVLGTTTQQYDETIAAGVIIAITPEPGTQVRRDTAVDVVVSRGPAPVTIPTLVGQPIAAVKDALTTLGLTTSVQREYSETVARGAVISASPTAGTEVPRGTSVALVVSDGPPLVVVPDVVGKSQRDATDTLEALGFQVKVTFPLQSTPFKRVATQSVKAGTAIPKGSTITLQVV